VRIPEEIRSRLAVEVERFSQMLAPRTGVPITASNLIRSFLEDFMDAMETGETPEWPIRIQRSTNDRSSWPLFHHHRPCSASATTLANATD
jgi:hypothetical protein